MREENIFELLNEWDAATFYEDKVEEREAGRKIKALRKEYREKGDMLEKVKIVGHFNGNMCTVYVNNMHTAIVFDLEYTGHANEYDDKRMYRNRDTHIWFDYAVYE